jgi:hypothetical protein
MAGGTHGIQIVSRNSYPNYSNAITAALPQARQVVNRWHLLKKLGDALQKLLKRNRHYHKYTQHKWVKQSDTYRKEAGKQTRPVSKNYSHQKWQFDQLKHCIKKAIVLKQLLAPCRWHELLYESTSAYRRHGRNEALRCR